MLEKNTQKQITKLLRKLTLMMILCFSLSAWSHGAEEKKNPSELYASNSFREAANAWLAEGDYTSLSAQTFFNVGNCCYRLGMPGYAALYYRRALAVDGSFTEAAQNLRFIERMQGSIVLQHNDFNKKLILLSRDTIKNICYITAWLILLSILTLYAANPKTRLRITAITLLSIAPFVLFAALYALKNYPDAGQFAPLSEQAVIVSPETVAYAEASRTSPEVISAPVGSLCRIIQASDRWVYVKFASNTMGWIPSENLELLMVKNTPKIPKSAAERENKTN